MQHVEVDIFCAMLCAKPRDMHADDDSWDAKESTFTR